jgi:hypothetical protein
MSGISSTCTEQAMDADVPFVSLGNKRFASIEDLRQRYINSPDDAPRISGLEFLSDIQSGIDSGVDGGVDVDVDGGVDGILQSYCAAWRQRKS